MIRSRFDFKKIEYSVSNDPGFSLMDVTVEMPATSHDLGNAKISGIKDKVYTGKPLTQNPVVKMLDDEVLERGRDYTVTLKSNKDVGYGTVLSTEPSP